MTVSQAASTFCDLTASQQEQIIKLMCELIKGESCAHTDENELEKMKESVFVPEIQPQVRALCRSLARTVQEYYTDPQHRSLLPGAFQ